MKFSPALITKSANKTLVYNIVLNPAITKIGTLLVPSPNEIQDFLLFY